MRVGGGCRNDAKANMIAGRWSSKLCKDNPWSRKWRALYGRSRWSPEAMCMGNSLRGEVNVEGIGCGCLEL